MARWTKELRVASLYREAVVKDTSAETNEFFEECFCNGQGKSA
jgi:hypothetical protein